MFERTFPDGTRIFREDDFHGGAHELILERDGKRLSRTVIIPTLIRIGEAVVRADGIGGVETDEEHRYRGYSRRVMETCLETMIAGDAALSLLWGIEDYYPKFGFASAGPEPTVTIWLPQSGVAWPRIPEGWTVRDYRSADLPAIQRIYHLNTKNATGAVARPSDQTESDQTIALIRSSPEGAKIVANRAWKKLDRLGTQPDLDDCRVILNESGEIVAYVWLGNIENWWMLERHEAAPASFHIAEAIAVDSRSADAVVALCRAWALEGGKSPDDIRLGIPPEGPVAAAAALEGGNVLLEHTRDGNFMGRTLDVERLLRQMSPEFTARIRESSSGFDGDLIFETEIGDGAISISPDKVAFTSSPRDDANYAAMPQAMLARLCLGAFETRDVIDRLPERPRRAVQELLEILFPKRNPHVYPMDRF